MDPRLRQVYDAVRPVRNRTHSAACYAPWAAMYFDPHGLVQACCLNLMHSLGNVSTQSLVDIWRSPKAEELRQAMRDYDLTHGCRHCLWHIDSGAAESVYALRYEPFADAFDGHDWPRIMEFQISNVCNLECLQCRGEWSSLVRKNRERLPPLAKVYGERFFSELRPFLPHLVEAHFLGGEPFLAPETLRIWEMMIEDGLSTACYATTNGTIFDHRVERILEKLPVGIILSLDGCTRETYETIRRNANFDHVMENLERFRRVTRERGTTFHLTHCLMRQNWREFGDFLLLGDRCDCDVYVNIVLEPPEASLYRLPRRELQDIVSAMEAQSAGIEARLTRNRPVWRRELARLRAALLDTTNVHLSYISSDLLRGLEPSHLTLAGDASALQGQGLSELKRGVGADRVEGLVCDLNDVVLDLADGGAEFLGCRREAVLGRRIADVRHHLPRAGNALDGRVRRHHPLE